MTAPLLTQFEVEVLKAFMGAPTGSKYTCACGSGVLVPAGVDTPERRKVWLAFAKAHTGPTCKVQSA